MPPSRGSMSVNSRTATAEGRKKITSASSQRTRLAGPIRPAVVSQRSPTIAEMLNSTTSRSRMTRGSWVTEGSKRGTRNAKRGSEARGTLACSALRVPRSAFASPPRGMDARREPADRGAERRPAGDIRGKMFPRGHAQRCDAHRAGVEQHGVAAAVRQALAPRHHEVGRRRREGDRRVARRKRPPVVGRGGRGGRGRRVEHRPVAVHQDLEPLGRRERPGERVPEHGHAPARLCRGRAVERDETREPDDAPEQRGARGAGAPGERMQRRAVDAGQRRRIARRAGGEPVWKTRRLGDQPEAHGRHDRRRVPPGRAIGRLPGARSAQDGEQREDDDAPRHAGSYAVRTDRAPIAQLSRPCGIRASPLPCRLPTTNYLPEGPVSTETLQHVALFEKVRNFLPKAREVQAAGLHAWYKPISRSEDTVVVIEGKERIMMGSNNYLGLTHHPEVLAAGNQANLGVVSGLVGRGDVVFLDKLDHASIVDGAKMSYGQTERFGHGDMAELERKIQRVPASVGKMIIVDGVYSMEGDIAEVAALLKIAQRYGAVLAVDDAHAVGVLGPRGDGTAAHFGLTEEVDLIVGTFSKSLASIGGFVAGPETVISFLRYNARPLVFTAALPPSNTAGVLAALHILQREPERRESLWANARRLQQGLRSLGFDIGTTETPIVPFLIGEFEKTLLFWRKLFDAGVFTNPVVPPALPPSQCRLRTSVMATHTPDQIDYALETFGRLGKELGVI